MEHMQPNDRPNYRLNSFRLDGIADVSSAYRLLSFTGLLPTDPDIEKKVGLLCRLLRSALGAVVEPIRVNGERRLGIACDKAKLENLAIPETMALTPEVVSLAPASDIKPLRFVFSSNRAERALVDSSLWWALDRALSDSGAWWTYGSRYVSKYPDNDRRSSECDLLPAFFGGFVPGQNGTPELILDPSVCYMSKKNLLQEQPSGSPSSLKGQYFLYKYGSWYVIDALGTGGSPDTVQIVHPSTGTPVTISQFIQSGCSKTLPPTPYSVQYKTAGEKTRYAHPALLYRLPKADPRADLHPHTGEGVLPPEIRGARTEAIAESLQGRLKLFGVPLRLTRKMRSITVGHVPAPRLRFAGDQEIATNLASIRQDRYYALKGLGPAETTPFGDQQLILIPDSIPRALREDFCRRFKLHIGEFYAQSYNPEIRTYSAPSGESLKQQAQLILKACASTSGYALLILPERRPSEVRRLHDYVKRTLWHQLQTQCALAPKIASFYCRIQKRGFEDWVVRNSANKDYTSYLRQLALAYLIVNRKWLWKLGVGTLKHDLHIGIDVYKGTAVFTFIHKDADLIAFDLRKANRQELLSPELLCDALVSNLERDLKLTGFRPAKIIVSRDGLCSEGEERGIDAAFKCLKQRGLTAPDPQVGVIEVRKLSSNRLRLYRWMGNRFQNPEMGTFHTLSDHEMILANTGDPLLRRGTALPLYLVSKSASLKLEDVAADFYALSHLGFTAPGICHRVHFPIELADLILKESSPGDEHDELWADADTASSEYQTAKGVAV